MYAVVHFTKIYPLVVSVQILSLAEISPSEDLQYIYSSCILLLINMVVSPLILCFRRYNPKQNKFYIYCLDSLLDLLYLGNNLANRQTSSDNDNVFVHLAIGYPAFSIVLRVRSVFRASTINNDDASLMRETGSSRSFVRAISIKTKLTKLQIQNCYHIMEKAIYLAQIVCGVTAFSIIHHRIVYQNTICRDELTGSFYDNASPKIMFTNTIWSNPSK
jgi:hypothetical protein